MKKNLATYPFAETVSKSPKSPEMSFRAQRSGAEESRPTGLARPIRRDPFVRALVVPNPYVATNRFEGLNPFSTGRGPRVLKFMRVPPECVIRIYSVGGRLIRVLRHNEGSNEGLSPEALLNGTVDWDLESEEGLGVSYGIYLYHIEAPGIGEATGTFAIIK